VPIVVERTMWFPGPDTTPAFANTAATDGYVRMTAVLEHGQSTSLGFNIRANSRFTVDIGQALQLSGEHFAVIAESIAEGSFTVVPIVVERAMYWDAGGVVWAAGTNVLATPIP
jgi:hypothetical protein